MYFQLSQGSKLALELEIVHFGYHTSATEANKEPTLFFHVQPGQDFVIPEEIQQYFSVWKNEVEMKLLPHRGEWDWMLSNEKRITEI